MKKIISKGNLLRTLLFIGTVAIIYLFLPSSDTFKYSYSLGKPWNYSLLTAPFDIPIELDSVSMASKRDSIDRTIVKIYRNDKVLARQRLSDFSQHLDTLPILPASKNRMYAALRRVYDDGIVDADTYTELSASAQPTIKLMEENEASAVPAEAMRSPREAYRFVDSVAEADPRHLHLSEISNFIEPNIIVDNDLTMKLREAAYQKALAPIGLLQMGERIVDRGDIITLQTYTILNTYQNMMAMRDDNSHRRHYPSIGKAIVVVILLTSLYLFLFLFRWRFFNDLRKMTFLMILITVFTIMALLMIKHTHIGVYILPFAMIPILMTTFFDSRTAMYVHIHEVLICTMVGSMSMEFVFLQFPLGIAAITPLKELSRRAQLMRTAGYVFVTYCITYAAFGLVKAGFLVGIDYRMIIYFAINSALLSLSYILIFAIEKMFGFISTVTLVELSDVNNPLLRELAEQCPGTFQHSLQVANLATEAARKINANVQLVRTGALYHDIGKMSNPAFFTENQRGVNPHGPIPPERSAEIVIAHVRDGLKMAERAKLPKVLRAFIAEHHGCGKAKYFYNTACNAADGATIDPRPFTYPGPNPQSKETTILMMADAVEASSRSLKEHTDQSITALVNKIINGQIADGLFIDSPLSFRDVEEIKGVFIDRLKTIFHTRISYPELNNKKE